MLTEEKYKEFVRRSEEDKYFLTPAEKKEMRSYLDNCNATRPHYKGGGLMQLVARGPTCWNGGLQHRLHWKDGKLQWKYGGGKKCWCCDSNHR